MSTPLRYLTGADGTRYAVVLDLDIFQRLLDAAGLTEDALTISIPNPATGEDILIDTTTMKPTVVDE